MDGLKWDAERSIETPIGFREALSEYRRQHLLSQKGMGLRLGLSQAAIGAIELGRHSTMHLLTFQKVSNMIGWGETKRVLDMPKDISPKWYKNPERLINVLLWLAIIVNALALIFLLVR